jgi:tRNA A37 threonylcarbamoyladenosine biosynthesis protein TsaE
MVVWLNGHFGAIRQDGKDFRDMQVYQTHKERVRGIVHLPQRTASTFGTDVKEMMQKHLTFDEAIASPDFSVMSKQRLKIIQRDVYRQLEPLL